QGEYLCSPERRGCAGRHWNYIHARNAPNISRTSGEFRITPDVSTLSNRYWGYREGKEPLQAMAYFCLTVLLAGAKGRGKAAAMFRIDAAVLRKLGELT